MAQTTSGLAGTVGTDARNLVRRTWWVFLLGGLASLLFGILAFVNPGLALLVLAMFFAAAILVDGAFNVLGSIQNRDKDGWWLMLLIGILGVGIGAYALLNPPVSMLAFVFLMGLLLSMASPALETYSRRVAFVFLAGLVAVVLVDVGQPIWWRHSWDYWLANGAYHTVGSLLVGLVLARYPGKKA